MPITYSKLDKPKRVCGGRRLRPKLRTPRHAQPADVLGAARSASDVDESESLGGKRRRRKRLLTVVAICALIGVTAIATAFVAFRMAHQWNPPLQAGVPQFRCDDLVSTSTCEDEPSVLFQSVPSCGAAFPNATRVAVLGNPDPTTPSCLRAVGGLLDAMEWRDGKIDALLTTGGSPFVHDLVSGPQHADDLVADTFSRFLNPTQRFFPALGPADFDPYWRSWPDVPYMRSYPSLLDLPGPTGDSFLRGQAYTATIAPGLMDVFVVNSLLGDTSKSYAALAEASMETQKLWLRAALGNSTAVWRVVVFHHSPYSTSKLPPEAQWMRWPFREWGASVVLTGSQGVYERIQTGSSPVPFVINGLGGHPAMGRVHACQAITPGSRVRYNSGHGVQLMVASETSLRFCFYSTERRGTLVDAFTIHAHEQNEDGQGDGGEDADGSDSGTPPPPAQPPSGIASGSGGSGDDGTGGEGKWPLPSASGPSAGPGGKYDAPDGGTGPSNPSSPSGPPPKPDSSAGDAPHKPLVPGGGTDSSGGADASSSSAPPGPLPDGAAADQKRHSMRGAKKPFPASPRPPVDQPGQFVSLLPSDPPPASAPDATTPTVGGVDAADAMAPQASLKHSSHHGNGRRWSRSISDALLAALEALLGSQRRPGAHKSGSERAAVEATGGAEPISDDAFASATARVPDVSRNGDGPVLPPNLGPASPLSQAEAHPDLSSNGAESDATLGWDVWPPTHTEVGPSQPPTLSPLHDPSRDSFR